MTGGRLRFYALAPLRATHNSLVPFPLPLVHNPLLENIMYLALKAENYSFKAVFCVLYQKNVTNHKAFVVFMNGFHDVTILTIAIGELYYETIALE